MKFFVLMAPLSVTVDIGVSVVVVSFFVGPRKLNFKFGQKRVSNSLNRKRERERKTFIGKRHSWFITHPHLL